MPTIFKSIDIDAPPERVFALIGPMTKQSEWAIFLKDAQLLSGDGTSPGSTYRWAFKVGPRSQPLEAVIAAYNENEALVRRTRGALQMEDRLFLAPIGAGTRVEWTIYYKPPFGPLGALLDLIFVNRVFQNDVETSLERLKRQLEG